MKVLEVLRQNMHKNLNLSFTTLKDFLTCPESAWLKKGPLGYAAAFDERENVGSLVHKMYELNTTEIDYVDPTMYLEAMQIYEQSKDYVDSLEIPETAKKEGLFSVKLEGHNLYISPDISYEKNGYTYILDYKTNNSIFVDRFEGLEMPNYGKLDSFLLQFITYAYGLYKKGQGKKFKGQFIFLKLMNGEHAETTYPFKKKFFEFDEKDFDEAHKILKMLADEYTNYFEKRNNALLDWLEETHNNLNFLSMTKKGKLYLPKGLKKEFLEYEVNNGSKGIHNKGKHCNLPWTDCNAGCPLMIGGKEI